MTSFLFAGGIFLTAISSTIIVAMLRYVQKGCRYEAGVGSYTPLYAPYSNIESFILQAHLFSDYQSEAALGEARTRFGGADLNNQLPLKLANDSKNMKD